MPPAVDLLALLTLLARTAGRAYVRDINFALLFGGWLRSFRRSNPKLPIKVPHFVSLGIATTLGHKHTGGHIGY